MKIFFSLFSKKLYFAVFFVSFLLPTDTLSTFQFFQFFNFSVLQLFNYPLRLFLEIVYQLLACLFAVARNVVNDVSLL
jgi:hypothetical protein